MEIIKAEVPDIVVAHDPAALEERDELVVKAAGFVRVTNESEADRASRHCQAMKRLVSDTEKNRKQIKEPVQKLGKAIDAMAKSFIESLNAEIKRIGGLITTFSIEQKEKAEAEQRKIEEERQQKLLEAKAAQEKADAAARKAAKKNQGLSAAEEAILAEQEADQKRQEAEEALRAPNAEQRKVSGTVNRTVLRYKITDPVKVYATHPHFFSLVEKRSVINDTITKDTKIEGMEVWEESVVGFRS